MNTDPGVEDGWGVSMSLLKQQCDVHGPELSFKVNICGDYAKFSRHRTPAV